MTAPRRPLAVLFDLDGTLVDSIGLLLGSMRHAFRDRAHRPTDAEWVAGIGTPLRAQLRRWAADDLDLVTLESDYRNWQREHHDALTRCYDGVTEVVRSLHAAGHPIALVTSKSEPLARRALEWVGLLDVVAPVVGLESTTVHKPAPEPVLHALSVLGYAPAEAVFVGDSPHDMNSGNTAGVATIAALWGPFSATDLDPSRPIHRIADIRELPPLLAEIARRI